MLGFWILPYIETHALYIPVHASICPALNLSAIKHTIMALTYWISANAGGSGNYDAYTQYYAEDQNTVLNQAGAVASGLANLIFRNESITVFAVRNSRDEIFGLVALPCPPYHHSTMPEAIPGNILT